MIVHNSYESLHIHISAKILPKEYKGTSDTFEQISTVWVDKLKNSYEFFLEESKYGIDEELKKKNSKTKK